jgi:hydroxyacyl-ACP dehydratase HTD2-like protein with hotdog domain
VNARAKELPPGFELPPFRRTITRNMAITHASPMKNFHTVLEEAQALGYPDIVIAGPMFTCFFSEMFTRFFGEAWITGGSLRFKLLKPVFAGETISARAVVSGHELGADGVQLQLEIWCEREQDSVRTSSGSAAVWLRE